MKERLEQGLAALGLTPPPGAVERLERYAHLLLEQNKVMNLTAITQPDQVADLHFLDCAGVALSAGLAGKKLIDVGTRAGFPGMVLKLLVPDLELTLVDSLGKRLDWLSTVCADLGLTDVTIRHARGEELSHDPAWREGFDFAAARAVAELRVLCELCLPYVKPGGQFLAMKAADCRAEVDQAGRAVSVLGGRLLPAFRYTVPNAGVERLVVRVEKTAPTPKSYPRRWARIQKDPL